MYIQTYNLCIILSFQQVHDYTKIINSYLTHTYRLIKQCETITDTRRCLHHSNSSDGLLTQPTCLAGPSSKTITKLSKKR